MIKKEIEIDGKKVPFRASATIPRLYRAFFRRDIFKDFARLESGISKEGDLQIEDLEIFENVAFVMAKHADPKQPDTPEEWLEQFNMLSIYEVLPQLIELWSLNTETGVKAKKNLKKVQER